MAILEDFPQTLIDEHVAWHMNPPGTPGARSATNRGLDFLDFHRDYLTQVFDWFGKQPADYQAKYDLSPSWVAIPTELKTDPATGWDAFYAANEQRILTFTPPFSGENDFGLYVEQTIHNGYLHGACAIHYKEPVLNTMESPRSTWFYKIHGLIDKWRQAFEASISIRVHNRNFQLASQILFGLIDDTPGVVIGADGKPHPVDPGWGSLIGLTSHQAKQAVIQMAVHRLSASLSPEHAPIVMEPVSHGGEPAIGTAWAPEPAMPGG